MAFSQQRLKQTGKYKKTVTSRQVPDNGARRQPVQPARRRAGLLAVASPRAFAGAAAAAAGFAVALALAFAGAAPRFASAFRRSGAAVFAAVALAKELGPGKRIAVIIPDSAERYLSKKIFEGGV